MNKDDLIMLGGLVILIGGTILLGIILGTIGNAILNIRFDRANKIIQNNPYLKNLTKDILNRDDILMKYYSRRYCLRTKKEKLEAEGTYADALYNESDLANLKTEYADTITQLNVIKSEIKSLEAAQKRDFNSLKTSNLKKKEYKALKINGFIREDI